MVVPVIQHDCSYNHCTWLTKQLPITFQEPEGFRCALIGQPLQEDISFSDALIESRKYLLQVGRLRRNKGSLQDIEAFLLRQF